MVRAESLRDAAFNLKVDRQTLEPIECIDRMRVHEVTLNQVIDHGQRKVPLQERGGQTANACSLSAPT